MVNEGTNISTFDFERFHKLSFDGHGSIQEQMEYYDEVPFGAGMVDIHDNAKQIMVKTRAVANKVEPPRLPFERF